MTTSADSPEKPRGKKKPYKKPELQVYGDLRTITNHVGNTSTNPDPGPHGTYLFDTH